MITTTEPMRPYYDRVAAAKRRAAWIAADREKLIQAFGGSAITMLRPSDETMELVKYLQDGKKAQ